MTAAIARDEGFSWSDVCAAVGCSFRMLDYWTRLGLVRPSVAAARGSGTRRRWSADDVHRLRIVAAVMRHTGSSDVAALALRRLNEDGRWLVCTDTDAIVAPDGHLERVLAETGGGTVVDLRPADTGDAA